MVVLSCHWPEELINGPHQSRDSLGYTLDLPYLQSDKDDQLNFPLNQAPAASTS